MANETLHIYMFLYNSQKTQEGCFIYCNLLYQGGGINSLVRINYSAPPPPPTYPKKLA